MAEAPLAYAAIVLVIALIAGLIPVFSKIKQNPERLKMITSIASGIIIASAVLVIIPEGYALATQEDSHAEDEALAGSIALILLEVGDGDITEEEAIEEIEELLGGHDEHDEDDDHEEESHDEHGHEEGEESLSDSVMEIIEEYEEGTIDSASALNEIQTAISGIGHEHEEDDGHGGALLIGGALLAGFLLMLILEGSGIGHAVHEEHHDHSDEHGHGHVHHSAPGWMLVLGLTLHSATDGIAIGAAAATGSAALTATILLAIVIHKAPVAFSLGIFSMHERETRNETIRDVVIFALSTPVMMILAFYALTGLEVHTIGLAMLFSAGTFLYIATVDTLPDIHNPETGKKAMMYLLVGVAILVALLVLGNALDLNHAH